MLNNPIFADRVQESATVAGTGLITLGGAAAGYQSFQVAFSAKSLTKGYCRYCISDLLGNWEVGTGYFEDSIKLNRIKVHSSSNSNALVDFPAGDKTAMLTASADIFGALPLLDQYNSLSLYLSGLLFTLLANVALGSTGDWQKAVWSGALYIAIKASGGSAWSLDGITWTYKNIESGAKVWRYLTWDGTRFIAAPESSDYIYTSENATTWTKRFLPQSGTWSGLCSVGGKSFLVGDPGIVLVTDDGINWTRHDLSAASYVNRCASNGSTICFLTQDGVFTSTDGTTWQGPYTVPSSSNSNNWKEMIWTGSEFACLNGFNELLSSIDGVTWGITVLPGAVTWTAIGGNGVVRVLIGSGSTSYLTSRDLINWKARTAPMTISGNAISWDGKEFLFLQSSGGNAVKTLDLTA